MESIYVSKVLSFEFQTLISSLEKKIKNFNKKKIIWTIWKIFKLQLSSISQLFDKVIFIYFLGSKALSHLIRLGENSLWWR